MADKVWKALERRVAEFFGSIRTPLSGSSSAHTSSDSLHPTLFIETKHRKKHTLYTLWRKTKALALKEKKTPVLAIHEDGAKGFLIVVHSEDLIRFLEIIQQTQSSTPCLSTSPPFQKLPAIRTFRRRA